MRNHPYSDLPGHCFWSRTHRAADLPDPEVTPGLDISPEDRIATAGSCFAQHIAQRLQRSGYDYLVTEEAHPVIDPPVAKAFNYGTFSARFGNIYTARQLHQLALRAYGLFTPKEDVWEQPDGTLVDPFRPAIQPGGFSCRAAFLKDRERHFAAVRRMIEDASVFVFTFGLTEGWMSKEDGAVFGLAPGVAGGKFDPARHAFANFTASETAADFAAFAAFARERNPDLRFVVTVSPVPLAATARKDAGVLVANTYSKAALRVAAEEVSRTVERCWYFPSYEIITSAASKGAHFARDLRSVEPAGVDRVMRLFLRTCTRSGGPATDVDAAARRAAKAASKAAGVSSDEDAFTAEVGRTLDVICEETLIEEAAR
ncbi:GSCFA domain-containing protein [Roseicyclus sp. F158]|uniref:GSCFA domain-containing protein n=1 Tax=Tropicimonas omnivorans TaxID=3075590 RepID=A0ABU3DBW7_9RHOB|nr:GSCFA domain-containing protein [Roseicyclus sp. F158]MDT0681198.1 GSCFA domain-containing protein [Roseicyclus sp. F158]